LTRQGAQPHRPAPCPHTKERTSVLQLQVPDSLTSFLFPYLSRFHGAIALLPPSTRAWLAPMRGNGLDVRDVHDEVVVEIVVVQRGGIPGAPGVGDDGDVGLITNAPSSSVPRGSKRRRARASSWSASARITADVREAADLTPFLSAFSCPSAVLPRAVLSSTTTPNCSSRFQSAGVRSVTVMR